MASQEKVIVARYVAAGGPPYTGVDLNKNKFGPTDPGQYVIARCQQHVSEKLYKKWSGLAWGTKLRVRRNMGAEIVEAYIRDQWRPINPKFTSATVEEIKIYNKQLYEKYEVPDKWVFNDFGHNTCYMFKDINKNFKLDGKDQEHDEFIHTTPDNEAQTAKQEKVIIDYSHGCIHVKPTDLDDMIAKNYLKKGNVMFVYSYTQKAPIDPVRRGTAPFELHFYPAAYEIQVYGVKP